MDFSFAELLLVVVVAVIFIGPKELPVVVRALVKAMRWVKNITKDLRGMFDDLAKESGVKDTVDEFNAEMRLIKGDDGHLYESYDIQKKSVPRAGDGN